MSFFTVNRIASFRYFMCDQCLEDQVLSLAIMHFFLQVLLKFLVKLGLYCIVIFELHSAFICTECALYYKNNKEIKINK